MFKGLHSTLHKTKPVETSAKHPDVTIVQPAATLLQTEKRQQHLKNIKTLLNLPPKLFDSLYQRVINQFVEFCQSLPETQHGLFANEGGFLDHGLERASRALSLCLSYFFPQEKTLQNISSQEALWIYAVFTAALFLDVGKITVKYQVHLCNRDGSVLKEWSPYSGSMMQQAKFYRFDFVKENRDNLKRHTTALVARQILDSHDGQGINTSGFNWIASNPDVLENWLIILFGEKRIPMTSFMSVIPIVDTQIIEAYLANLFPEHTLTNPHGLFEKPKTEATHNFEAGKDFIHWLKENITNNKISINQPTADSEIHVVNEGVLINPELFERFAKEHFKHTNPSVVKSEVIHMVEVLFESAAVQLRYRAIGGISARTNKNIINSVMLPAELALPAGYKAQISKEVAAIPSQTSNLPASPKRAEQQSLAPKPSLNV